MKKLLLTMLILVSLCLTASAQVVLNATNFPDANFRAALASLLSIGEGETITEEKIASTKTINVSSKNISNLTGIGYFTALEELQCQHNKLKSIDLSNLIELQLLSAWDNQLDAIDVSMLPYLFYLDVEMNNLTTLNLTNNPELAYLFVSVNKLKTLDTSAMSDLEGINGYNNRFEYLDFTNNTGISELYLEGNCLSEGATDALIETLPSRTSTTQGVISIYNPSDNYDKNVCNKNSVAKAKAKNWAVKYCDENAADTDTDPYLKNYEGTEPTGINTMSLDEKSNGNRYNLSGQRVSNSYKGLMIEKGRKRLKR